MVYYKYCRFGLSAHCNTNAGDIVTHAKIKHFNLKTTEVVEISDIKEFRKEIPKHRNDLKKTQYYGVRMKYICQSRFPV